MGVDNSYLPIRLDYYRILVYMVRPDLEDLIKRYENFLVLRKQGATLAEIGEMYGITRQAVADRIKKGVPKERVFKGGILFNNGFPNIRGRGRARMMVRIRDDFTCQDCGLRRTNDDVKHYNKEIIGLKDRLKNLDVHHTHGKCGKNTRGYDSVANLAKMVTLCHRCHYNRPEHRCQSATFKKKHV